MDSESWEEAIEDKFELDARKITANKKVMDIKMEILHRLLWCVRELIRPVCKPDVEDMNDLHTKERLEEYANDLMGNGTAGTIALFKLLLLHRISSRIYFILSEDVQCFLETRILNNIVQHHKKYGWCVVSVDGTFRLVNQSYHFSVSPRHHSIVDYVIRSLNKTNVCRNMFGVNEEMFECFVELDRSRMSKIPKSINKFKKHPKYVLESVLRQNQCIYPRRPVHGYFKGEAIYSRENTVLLRTKEQFYKLGKVPNTPTPYRVDNKGTRLYAPWQVSDLVVEGFSESMYQDCFYPNFVPKDCVFLNNRHAKDVAYLLGFPHRICFHGFSGRVPVNRGIFLEKKNLYLFSNFLAEYCRYSEMKMKNEHGARAFRKWRVLIRNAAKYLTIRRELGLDELKRT